eukprot:m51a1_g8007 hypothetical protein (441) ;mRNA; r:164972-166544
MRRASAVRPSAKARALRAAGACALRYLFLVAAIGGTAGVCALAYVLAPPEAVDVTFAFAARPGPFARGLRPANATQRPTLALNSHAHSTASDGGMSPAQVVAWHASYGYDAFVMTDHNTAAGVDEARRAARDDWNGSVIVLPGVEWTTGRGHYNFIGVRSVRGVHADDVWERCPSDEDIRAAIAECHAAGGVVTVNHLGWSWAHGLNTPNLSVLAAWGVDYVEVAANWGVDQQSYTWASDPASGMGVIAGTDVHSAWANAYAYTTLAPAARSEEAVMAELRARRTSFIYSVQSDNALVQASGRRSANYVFQRPLILFGRFILSFFDREEAAPKPSGPRYCVGSGSGRRSAALRGEAKISSGSGLAIVDWGAFVALFFWTLVGFVAWELIRWCLVEGWRRARAWAARRRCARYDFVAATDDREWSCDSQEPLQLLDKSDFH